MGNPHAIVYMDDIDHLDIEKIGPAFENHVAFPDRVNTEFVEVIDEHTVKMRVWERGSGETLGTVPVKLLSAISCGAVFMGANTYIGNAPNFMVKTLSDENGINMPSFFGYMGWSICFLVPVFIIDMLVFFL